MPVVQPKNVQNEPRKQNEVRYDKVLMEPGEYEVSRNSTFLIKIPLKKKDKWWVLADKEDADVVEEVVFRMWTYDEMIEMRKLATQYDQMRRVHMIDHDVLNRLKIQRLMTKWSFNKGNPRLEIHHMNGVLVDESWEAVKRLQPNILKHIIEQMNERYEYGN